MENKNQNNNVNCDNNQKNCNNNQNLINNTQNNQNQNNNGRDFEQYLPGQNQDTQYRCLNCGAINYAYENEMPNHCMKCDNNNFQEVK